MISNREIKTLMSLSTKKGRKESGKYLIEGFRITRSALRNEAPVLKIYITDKFKTSNDFQQIFSLACFAWFCLAPLEHQSGPSTRMQCVAAREL